MGSRILLAPGTLWSRVAECTERALAQGALQPIPTRCETIEEQGVGFVLRMAPGLVRKQAQREATRQAPGNPFLPFDPTMLVAEVSSTHVCLLNKFNVLHHHVLLVTRHFEDQKEPLTLADFEALEATLREGDALAFYNGGEEAGASQRHRHLQLVPLPLGPGPWRLPVEPWFEALPAAGAISALPDLPLRHAVARPPWPTDRPLAAAWWRLHRELLEAVGPLQRQAPYNLLMTREWMMVVARTRASVASIEVNALGFAGSLFVRSDEQRAWLREHGPLRLLREVSVVR